MKTCKKCKNYGAYVIYFLPEGRPVDDYCPCVLGVLLHLAHYLQGKCPIEPLFMDNEGAVSFIESFLNDNGFKGTVLVDKNETTSTGFDSDEEIAF